MNVNNTQSPGSSSVVVNPYNDHPNKKGGLFLANNSNRRQGEALILSTEILLVAIIYFFTARIGQLLAIPPGNVTPIWIPSGIIFAWMVHRGSWIWPGILLGAFTGNAWAYFRIDSGDPHHILCALFSGSMNGIGDSLGTWFGIMMLMKHIRSKHNIFDNGSSVFWFLVYGVSTSAFISACFGVTSLAIAGFLPWENYYTTFITWFVGDAMGVLLLSPVLLLMFPSSSSSSSSASPIATTKRQAKDRELLLVPNNGTRLLEFIFYSIFSIMFPFIIKTLLQQQLGMNYPLFLLVPLYLWSVFRFTPFVSFSSVLLSSIIIIVLTALGIGPFTGGNSLNLILIEMQLFLSTNSITIMLVQSVVTGQQITEQKLKQMRDQLSKNLSTSIEDYQDLFDSMAQGVIYHDQSGKIVSANKNAQKILGTTFEEMKCSNSIKDLWHIINEDGSDFKEEQYPAYISLQSGLPSGKDIIMGIKSKTNKKSNKSNYTWVRVNSVPQFHNFEHGSSSEDDKKPWRAFATFSNISHLKEVESELVEQRNKAQKSDKLKSAFLANMSHEIRTPLNAVMGYVSLLQDDDKLSADQRQYLNTIQSSTSLLLGLINDILDMSKIEANELNVHEELVDVNELIEHVFVVARTYIDRLKKDITLDRSIYMTNKKDSTNRNGKKSIMIIADKIRLKQILLNLVHNSVKFMQSGKIEVGIEMKSSNFIHFWVRDEGPGIEPTFQMDLFKPFRQGKQAKHHQLGSTGLGLAISKKLTEMMGGSIWFQSSHVGPETGTTFFFTLPNKKPFVSLERNESPLTSQIDEKLRNNSWSDDNNDHTETTCTSTTSIASSCGSMNIINYENNNNEVTCVLLAEDDPVSHKMMKTVLSKKGIKVLSAFNGQQALDIYYQNYHQNQSSTVIDVMILDVQMPQKTGLEVTQEVREFEATANHRYAKQHHGGNNDPIPIICLSAAAMNEDIEKGLAVGASYYVTKPVSFPKLFGILRKLGK